MDGFLKRLLTVLASLFLLAYVGYQAFQVFYSPIQTETVYNAAVYETIDTEGMTVRNETTVPIQKSGYLYYTIADGTRVAKGGAIAYRFPTAEDAWKQQQLNLLDKEVDTLKEIQRQGTANRINLDAINKQLDTALATLISGVNAAAIPTVREQRATLLELLNKQQMTVGSVKDFNARIAELNHQRAQLAASYAKSTGTVSSPIAGYFVSRVDGAENALPYDKATALTTERITAALAATPSGNTDAFAGKVVGDYQWYFTCVMDTSKAALLREEAEMNVLFPFLSDEAVPMTVAAINRDTSGKAAVVFRCSYMSETLADMRTETAQIRLVEHKGLRVPDDALVFNSDNERGVYVRVGNTVVFRKVDILYSESNFHICRDLSAMTAEQLKAAGLTSSEYLRLYDDVVVKGKKGLYDGKTVH